MGCGGFRASTVPLSHCLAVLRMLSVAYVYLEGGADGRPPLRGMNGGS